MGSITITADDEIIEQARTYAAMRKTSLNALGRVWLANLKPKKKKAEYCWTEELKAAIEAAQGNSGGWKWNREEIYGERIR